MHDDDFIAFFRADLMRRFPRDSDLWRALEVQWRLRWGGSRRYIAKKQPADAPESPRSDATEGPAT